MLSFDKYLALTSEIGVVEEIHHQLIIASGLPNATLGEIVVFEDGNEGFILALKENSIEILSLSHNSVKVGTRLTKTNQLLQINLHNNLLGRVINPFGQTISGAPISDTQDSESRIIDITPSTIANRDLISKPLITGISITDSLIPLGMGQRQLVVGDRKTGKTSFCLSVMNNQINSGSIGIYCAIGKKANEVKQIMNFFQSQGTLDRTIIVASTAKDSPSSIFVNPFAAMTIAEFFRDQGENVIIVFDDMLTHAQIYREISLIAKRFPGRESYPGDIFYTHARLLERAGNFTIYSEKGPKNISITCLPIIETTENDLTDYIVSNLIGITDGHLLFDPNEFALGKRPALNIPYSVTRVGKQTQSIILQSLNQKLVSIIAHHTKAKNFARFGQELNEKTQKDLELGEKLFSYFNQPPNTTLPINLQVVFLTMLIENFFEEDFAIIHQYRDNLTNQYLHNSIATEIINQLGQEKSLRDLIKKTAQRKEDLLELCQKI